MTSKVFKIDNIEFDLTLVQASNDKEESQESHRRVIDQGRIQDYKLGGGGRGRGRGRTKKNFAERREA